MTIKTTFARTTREFSVALDPAASVKHRQKVIREFAKERFAEVSHLNRAALGYEPEHKLTIDGRQTYRIGDDINPDRGTVVYAFAMFAERVQEIVDAALEALRDASPVVSGAYHDGHSLYVNDQPVDELPDTVSASDAIMIANPVPYARRIEVGKRADGTPFVIQVEPRVYERVTKTIIAPRFGNQAKISFGYAVLPSAPRVSRGTLQSPAMFIEPLAS